MSHAAKRIKVPSGSYPEGACIRRRSNQSLPPRGSGAGHFSACLRNTPPVGARRLIGPCNGAGTRLELMEHGASRVSSRCVGSTGRAVLATRTDCVGVPGMPYSMRWSTARYPRACAVPALQRSPPASASRVARLGASRPVRRTPVGSVWGCAGGARFRLILEKGPRRLSAVTPSGTETCAAACSGRSPGPRRLVCRGRTRASRWRRRPPSRCCQSVVSRPCTSAAYSRATAAPRRALFSTRAIFAVSDAPPVISTIRPSR